MLDKNFIFLAGLHRSGTSLLHEIIRGHPEISGFSDTGAPEDEGQHLQSVFNFVGGVGQFALKKGSYMDESHPLATEENAKRLFQQWSQYWDLSREYLVEKSPPNIVRTRFLQALFPDSKFVIILRHPIAVSYASKIMREVTFNKNRKKKKIPIKSYLENALLAYEIFLGDIDKLDNVYVLKYEEFVLEPQKSVDDIFCFLELDPINITHKIRADVNQKYFSLWEKDQKKLFSRYFLGNVDKMENRAREFGYSLKNVYTLSPCSMGGPRKSG